MAESEKTAKSDQELFKFLGNRKAYPYNPEYVQHIQTHISHVFIAPPYVYKIKKTVDFGFLDYSTLEKRKHFCKREVELNRRLCSDIYLGVVSIAKSGNGYVIESNSGEESVEYAVKMKKLDDQYFLHSYIDNNTLTNQHLDRVADTLADFYLQQEPTKEVLNYGKSDQIRFNTDENFQQTEQFIGETIDKEPFEAIRYYTNRYFDKNKQLFNRRIEEQRIIDGHGDLHLEHIHIRREQICIYDCIEFNERFRYGDWAVDLAFLAMDLDFNDRWKEERYFVDQMANKLMDPNLHEIIDFYKCYRAYVKGKVKSLQSAGEEVSVEDRHIAQTKAIDYFNLSLRYALLGSKPTVLIFMGRVATGKSTLAKHTSEKMGIAYYSSDRIRKTLAGLPIDERTPRSERQELYSTEMSQKTYTRMFEEVKVHIQNGESVILDATFSSRSSRKELIDELDAMDSEYLFIEAKAKDETIISRLRSRDEEKGTISDARVEDFEKIDARYDAPQELAGSNYLGVDTDSSLNKTLNELYQKLIDRQFLNKKS